MGYPRHRERRQLQVARGAYPPWHAAMRARAATSRSSRRNAAPPTGVLPFWSPVTIFPYRSIRTHDQRIRRLPRTIAHRRDRQLLRVFADNHFVDKCLFVCPRDESSREHVTADIDSARRWHSAFRDVPPGLDWADYGRGSYPQASDGGTLGRSADIEPKVGFSRSRDGGEALNLGRTETHPR